MRRNELDGLVNYSESGKFPVISLNFENTLKIFLDRKTTFVRNHPENLLQKDQENSQILAGCSAVALLLFLSRLLSWVSLFLPIICEDW